MKTIVLTFAFLGVTIAGQCQHGHKGVFDNAVYLRFGYSLPDGEMVTEEIITEGAGFEVGTIFYLNFLNFSDRFRVGIDATYASVGGYTNLNTLAESFASDTYYLAGLKIGPCVSYNFAGRWIVDATFKIHPHRLGAVEDFNHGYRPVSHNEYGSALGFNLRWRALMLGCEMTSAKYDFEITRSTDRSSDVTENKTVKLPATVLTIGFNF